LARPKVFDVQHGYRLSRVLNEGVTMCGAAWHPFKSSPSNSTPA
jgi:hypothetical protein